MPQAQHTHTLNLDGSNLFQASFRDKSDHDQDRSQHDGFAFDQDDEMRRTKHRNSELESMLVRQLSPKQNSSRIIKHSVAKIGVELKHKLY